MNNHISNVGGNSFALYKRLLSTYVWRYRGVLSLGVACMVVVAATTAGNAYIMQPVLDEIFVKKNGELLAIIPLVIMGLALANGIADYGQSLSLKYVGQKVVSDMQIELFGKLMHADVSMFHDQSTGRLISRLTNDIMLMRQSVSQVITGIVKESLTMICLIGVMFMQSVQMSIVAFAVLIFAVLPILRLGKRMRKIANSTQTQLADFTAQLDDTFQGVRVVKAYAREDFETDRARATIRQLFKLYYRAAKVQSASAPIMGLLGGCAIAAVIWYGGFKVISGFTTPGAFFSFITAMLMAYRPLRTIAGFNTQLQEGMAAAARFFEVMDITPTIHDAAHAVPLAIHKGEIAFEDVTFRYAKGGGGVEHVSFVVPAGKTVALVGASGAGKSTIMNLILRFYDIESGRILIDGQDVRNVTIASLRQSLSLVSQDIVLFDDTVRANIAYGRLGASNSDIIAAATDAHAHEFISQLPQGYDTPIGPHGVKLSGGQRQRLSIARAILKNAPILLLDEATSALDSASEHAVQEALTALMKDRTTLVIAHRLTTIQHADMILVLDGGTVVDKGTHEGLLAHSEIYRHMHRLHATPEEAV